MRWLLVLGLVGLTGCAVAGARPNLPPPALPASSTSPAAGAVVEPATVSAPDLPTSPAIAAHYRQRALFYRSERRRALAVDACERGLAREPNDATLHNLLGVLEVESGHPDRAIAHFTSAVALDPMLFEARMNLAAIHLELHAYALAEQGYRSAIALRPTDYDAHLGRAVALRGPLVPSDARLGYKIIEVEGELDAATFIDRERPEAYYNRGVLAQELKGWDRAHLEAARQQAEASFRLFLAKTKGKPAYAAAIERASDRLAAVTPAGLHLMPSPSLSPAAPSGTTGPPANTTPPAASPGP